MANHSTCFYYSSVLYSTRKSFYWATTAISCLSLSMIDIQKTFQRLLTFRFSHQNVSTIIFYVCYTNTSCRTLFFPFLTSPHPFSLLCYTRVDVMTKAWASKRRKKMVSNRYLYLELPQQLVVWYGGEICCCNNFVVW